MRAAGEGAYDCEVAPDWWVIAGPNGGYIGAIIVRALSSEPELGARPLRSITIHYLRAPAAGPARVFAEADRHGRSVSFMRARLEQDGRTCASALAVFADDRPGFELDLAAPPGGVEPPPPGAQDGEPPHRHAPPFAHEFVHLPRFGEPPFAGGGGEPLTGGWLRLRDERPLDAAALVALSDSWFPGGLRGLGGPAPCADPRADRARAGCAPAAGRLGAGQIQHLAGPRRLLGGGRRDLDTRRPAGRSVPPACARGLSGLVSGPRL